MRIVLAVLAALPYLPALANDFVWDDRLQILGNPHLMSLSGALGYFVRPEGLYYRPLIFADFAVETALWGQSALAFHLGNVALHSLNTLLVFTLARRTGLEAMLAFFGAAVFALHPLQSEAVAYVSGRTDLLMTTAALVACLLVLADGFAALPLIARGLLAAAATATSILSKETGYGLALLLPWLAWCHREHWQDRFAVAAPSVLVAIVLAVLRPAPVPPIGGDLMAMLSNAGATMREYVALLLWPANLQVDRLLPAGGPLDAVLALVVLAGFVYGMTRRGCVGDWCAWTAAFYAPVANLAAIYPQIAARALFTPEHNLYAPMAGIGMLLAVTVAPLRSVLPRRALAVAAAIVLSVWAGRSWARSYDWRDESTLFGSAASAGSMSPRVWFNLGNVLMQSGRRAEATAAYREAARIAPGDADVWMNLAVALQKQGAFDESGEAYRRAAELRPSPQLYRNLATLEHARGDDDAARAALARAEALGRTAEPR